MGHDPLIVGEKVHKSILESELIRGCTISYANKNIVDGELILIPKGITIQSTAYVFGLDGSMVMNIFNNKLIGVFHFATISLAEGNIVLFEENLDTSNNIIIRVEPDTDIDKDD